ncbi:conserved hypothetical protein [Rhodopseudomonas palustris TIE-1]|nr:conserved hypothetical protein [Rhodopseudomonas palustris TIE-1]
MHYRARLIPPRRRCVALSAEVEAARVSFPAIDHIKKAMALGEDLSPWLSNRIRKRRSDPKADLMFNDWQISHFHLGVFERADKVRRGRMLLFAHITADDATFLDVQPHRAWSTQRLLEILKTTSPHTMPDVGMLAGHSPGFSDEELGNLRRVGLTTPVKIGDKMYFPPGLGVSSSCHATRLVLKVNELERSIRDLARRLKENDLPSANKLEMLVLGRPIRIGLRLRFDGCLVICEKSRALDLIIFAPFA